MPGLLSSYCYCSFVSLCLSSFSQFSLFLQDTRAKEEYDVSHLPGAVRVDHEQEDFHSDLDLREVKTGQLQVVLCG